MWKVTNSLQEEELHMGTVYPLACIIPLVSKWECDLRPLHWGPPCEKNLGNSPFVPLLWSAVIDFMILTSYWFETGSKFHTIFKLDGYLYLCKIKDRKCFEVRKKWQNTSKWQGQFLPGLQIALRCWKMSVLIYFISIGDPGRSKSSCILLVLKVEGFWSDVFSQRKPRA